MNPMAAAIKRKRGMDASPSPSPMHSEESMHGSDNKGSNLHDFVSNLDDSQKAQLKSILDKSSKAVHEIQKGGPSSHEQQMISEASQKEDSTNSAMDNDNDEGGMGSHDSDSIAMSMLDHKSKMAEPGVKPRNLGERMKMNLASKLKAKGKL